MQRRQARVKWAASCCREKEEDEGSSENLQSSPDSTLPVVKWIFWETDEPSKRPKDEESQDDSVIIDHEGAVQEEGRWESWRLCGYRVQGDQGEEGLLEDQEALFSTFDDPAKGHHLDDDQA